MSRIMFGNIHITPPYFIPIFTLKKLDSAWRKNEDMRRKWSKQEINLVWCDSEILGPVHVRVLNSQRCGECSASSFGVSLSLSLKEGKDTRLRGASQLKLLAFVEMSLQISETGKLRNLVDIGWKVSRTYGGVLMLKHQYWRLLLSFETEFGCESLFQRQTLSAE